MKGKCKWGSWVPPFFWFGVILGSASRAEFPVSPINHVGFTPRLLYSSTHHSPESFTHLKTGWAQDAWLQWLYDFHLDISRWSGNRWSTIWHDIISIKEILGQLILHCEYQPWLPVWQSLWPRICLPLPSKVSWIWKLVKLKKCVTAVIVLELVYNRTSWHSLHDYHTFYRRKELYVS